MAKYEERPDPKAQSLTLFANRGVALFFSGDYLGAMRDFLEAVKISPENGKRRLSLGDAYQQLGRDEDARREHLEARRLLERDVVAQFDNLNVRATYAMSLAKTGDFVRALAEIERCEARHVERQADALHDVAKALALCGERDRALEALRKLTRTSFSKCLLRAEPEFASLRTDPEFRALMGSSAD